MTAMADREARLLDAVYRTYGQQAVWTPVAGGAPLSPTVRHATEDVELEFGEGRTFARRNLIYVRRSEMPRAAKGDVIAIAQPPSTHRVIAEPRLEPNGLEWLCEVSGT